MPLSKETREKIEKLQGMEQNMQNFLLQKQRLNSILAEIGSALSELGTSKESYKIVGNCMFLKDKESLKTELSDKKESISIRMQSIEKQEKKMREEMESIQSEVMKEMNESERRDS